MAITIVLCLNETECIQLEMIIFTTVEFQQNSTSSPLLNFAITKYIGMLVRPLNFDTLDW